MFFVRIRFIIKENLRFQINNNIICSDEVVLFEKENVICKVCREEDPKYKIFVMTYGGFNSLEDATNEGMDLFYNIKHEFINQNIYFGTSGHDGVLDNGKVSTAVGGITNYGKNLVSKVMKESCVRIENTEFGLKIYEVDSDLSEIKFVKTTANYKVKKPFPGNDNCFRMDDRLKTAYELLNSSNAVNDERVKFILRITALEAIVGNKEPKEEAYCLINKEIIKRIKIDELNKVESLSDIPESYKKRVINEMKSNIGNMKNKSVGEKCRELIQRIKFEKKYNKMNPLDFFDKCYKMRSNFIHAGLYDINEIKEFNSDLYRFVFDILDNYIESKK